MICNLFIALSQVLAILRMCTPCANGVLSQHNDYGRFDIDVVNLPYCKRILSAYLNVRACVRTCGCVQRWVPSIAVNIYASGDCVCSSCWAFVNLASHLGLN